MKMSRHQKFINELRAPVIRYNHMMQQRRHQKTTAPQSTASVSGEDSELMRELEAKFDELFGPIDDD